MLNTLKQTARKLMKPAPLTLQQRIPEITSAEIALIERVKPFTMTSAERLWALLTAIRYVTARQIPGAFVELGVWRGGSSMLAHLAFQQNGYVPDFWMYDTYEGMSEPTHLDRKANGGASAADKWAATRIGEGSDWCRAGLDDVRTNMESIGAKSVRYVVGKAEDTLPNESPEQVSILRIDTDWHAPTKAALETLYDRLSPGGVLIMDDYGSWEGAKIAADEFFATRKPVLMHRIDETGRTVIKD